MHLNAGKLDLQQAGPFFSSTWKGLKKFRLSLIRSQKAKQSFDISVLEYQWVIILIFTGTVWCWKYFFDSPFEMEIDWYNMQIINILILGVGTDKLSYTL